MLNIMGTIDKPTKGRVTLCGTSFFFYFNNKFMNISYYYFLEITPKTTDDELAQIRLEHLFDYLYNSQFILIFYFTNLVLEDLCFKLSTF